MQYRIRMNAIMAARYCKVNYKSGGLLSNIAGAAWGHEDRAMTGPARNALPQKPIASALPDSLDVMSFNGSSYAVIGKEVMWLFLIFCSRHLYRSWEQNVRKGIFLASIKCVSFLSRFLLLLLLQLRWSDALEWCWAHGGKLADVQTRPEMNFLLSLVRPHTSQRFWLGATNHGSGGDYVWVTRNFLGIDKTLFSKNGDQSPVRCTANCIGLKAIKGQDGLITYFCNQAKPFICKFKHT